MDPIIRSYQPSDRAGLECCLQGLQEYLVSLDRWETIRRPEATFATQYVDRLLQRIQEEHGAVFVAEVEGKVIGCTAGVIREPPQEVTDAAPLRVGRILELFVDEALRGRRLGASLMHAIEEHFRTLGCDVIRVEAFAPNILARRFYETCGYEQWVIDYHKRL